MARRRRSLLGAKGPLPVGASSDEPEASEAEASATTSESDAAAPEPEPPAPEPEPEPPAPEPEPEPEPPAPEPEPPAPEPEPPAPEPPAEDVYVSFDNAPTQPDEDAVFRQHQLVDEEPEVPEPPPSGPPAQPSFQALSGYQAPAAGYDAPVAQDLFGEGGYDDFDGMAPPTEEVPAGVMEDVGQPYATPYSVPEPPPIPGILDRFTPPPAQRTELGARKTKPDYLADTPPGSDRYQPTPAPPRKRTAAPDDDDRDEVERSGPPVGLAILVVGGGLGLLGVGAIVLAAVLMLGGDGGGDGGLSSEDGPEREQTAGGVKVRRDLQHQPGLIGVPSEQPVEPAPEVPLPAEPVGVEPAEPAPAPVPAPAAPKPQPAAPTPKPQPQTPKPQPAAQPAAAKGTLKIRSNRRVLVYVNGQAIGYTPQDYKVDPGTFSVSAMVPGQPGTKQTRDASVSAAGATVAVDFTF